MRCPTLATRRMPDQRADLVNEVRLMRQRRDRVVGGTHRAFLPYSRSSHPDSPRDRAFPVAPKASLLGVNRVRFRRAVAGSRLIWPMISSIRRSIDTTQRSTG